MPSPFPGMNPYLEHPSIWHDFHNQFCMSCRTALAQVIRPKYICQLEEHVYIHELSDDERRLIGHGDVTIAERDPKLTIESATAVGLMAPTVGRILPEVDEEREIYLEIRDREHRELVAVLELLSPTNKKRGSDRDQFLAKRRSLLDSPAHYVEIDLLRAGPRLPVEGLPKCDYYALVSRAQERPAVGIWASRLRQPLPAISIPLRSPDPDVTLDLQAILHSAYEAGNYDYYLYENTPEPLLSAEDQAWADELIKQSTNTI